MGVFGSSAGILAELDKSLSAGKAAGDNAFRAIALKNPHHNAALPLSVLKRIAPRVVVVCSDAPPSTGYLRRIDGL
jgi:hypothetical protein